MKLYLLSANIRIWHTLKGRKIRRRGTQIILLFDFVFDELPASFMECFRKLIGDYHRQYAMLASGFVCCWIITVGLFIQKHSYLHIEQPDFQITLPSIHVGFNFLSSMLPSQEFFSLYYSSIDTVGSTFWVNSNVKYYQKSPAFLHCGVFLSFRLFLIEWRVAGVANAYSQNLNAWYIFYN